MDDAARLQAAQNSIGYTFSDADLLARALRHSSYLNEHGMAYAECSERLEFLGDAVLELVSSRFLYTSYPEMPEGEMTRTRAGLVCEKALSEAARSMDLGSYLEMGKGEEKTGGREKPSILCDAVEAVIGAIYLDGGMSGAEEFILCSVLPQDAGSAPISDNKTALQEVLQKDGPAGISYRTEACPEEAGMYRSAVLFREKVLGTGTGRSKKAAEQEAAGSALEKLKNR